MPRVSEISSVMLCAQLPRPQHRARVRTWAFNRASTFELLGFLVSPWPGAVGPLIVGCRRVKIEGNGHQRRKFAISQKGICWLLVLPEPIVVPPLVQVKLTLHFSPATHGSIWPICAYPTERKKETE